jgi:hypothetical protein
VGVSKLRQVPWYPVVTLAVLGIALVVSTADGSTGDSLIIAALLGLGLLVYGGAAFLDLKRRGRAHQGR